MCRGGGVWSGVELSCEYARSDVGSMENEDDSTISRVMMGWLGLGWRITVDAGAVPEVESACCVCIASGGG
jgi:hypothetical protein